MKKVIIILSSVLYLSNLSAQENPPANKDWFHRDFKSTGIYGVGTNEALNFLKSKGLKPKTVVVAVIDSGIEIDHNDLKNNVWVNTKELNGKPGVDDDGNGYVDDLNGWNFIGGKTGENVAHDTMELTRYIVEKEAMFEGDDKEKNKTANPEEYKKYVKAKEDYDSQKIEAEQALSQIQSQKGAIASNIELIKNLVGGDIKLTPEVVENIKTTNEKDASIKEKVSALIANPEFSGKTPSELLNIFSKNLNEGEEYYGNKIKYALNKEFNPRTIVGDDYSNKKEKNYGNNQCEGPEAQHGTHVAGIIAAQRNNNLGIDGIAGDVAKILTVRAVPDGDERDKDIANSLRYAVDNGAQIINMSFGKSYSSDADLVWDAIKYAEKKGVLLVHAAGNDNKNLEAENNFPTNFKNKETKPFVNNWITVGSSTEDPKAIKSSFSNYGTTRVDLFAPGSDIYSLVPDNKYESLSGTSMASPVVTGCATVLKAYFPKLTPAQIKEILMSTSNKNTQNTNIEEDKVRAFDTLSVSGGVVDLHEAVKLAYEKYRK